MGMASIPPLESTGAASLPLLQGEHRLPDPMGQTMNLRRLEGTLQGNMRYELSLGNSMCRPG